MRIAPVLADSPARVLISGFMSHGATHLCAFCNCRKDMLGVIDSSEWTPRTGEQVREQATRWQQADTLAEHEYLEKTNGVRWTSLHRLPYWDPVKHVVLGFMHNWLEGILEDQLRILWGIGRDKAHEDRAKEAGTEDDADEQWDETDVAESGSELEELSRESSEHGGQSSQTLTRLRPRSDRSSTPTGSIPRDTDITMSSGSSTPTISSSSQPIGSPPPSEEGDASDPDDESYLTVPLIFNMPDANIAAIRQCIRDVTLPTWVGRPPVNLGEASHGKLKANDYLVLFSFILPLVVPEFWHRPEKSEADQLHLQSFEDLVICTNIVCSFKTSNADADLYTLCYKEYRRSLPRLYPFWDPKPNDHYAMHNSEFLKYWGPLPALSEFPGERLIGMLQDVNTNNKLRKINCYGVG